jgi:hypothetical protein
LLTLGFAFLKNIVACKTKAYGKLGFWELLVLFETQVGHLYGITCVGNILILKMHSSVLLYTTKTSNSWVFQIIIVVVVVDDDDDDDDNDDDIYCSDCHHRCHLSELSSSSSPIPHIYIKVFDLDSHNLQHQALTTIPQLLQLWTFLQPTVESGSLRLSTYII